MSAARQVIAQNQQLAPAIIEAPSTLQCSIATCPSRPDAAGGLSRSIITCTATPKASSAIGSAAGIAANPWCITLGPPAAQNGVGSVAVFQ